MHLCLIHRLIFSFSLVSRSVEDLNCLFMLSHALAFADAYFWCKFNILPESFMFPASGQPDPEVHQFWVHPFWQDFTRRYIMSGCFSFCNVSINV